MEIKKQSNKKSRICGIFYCVIGMKHSSVSVLQHIKVPSPISISCSPEQQPFISGAVPSEQVSASWVITTVSVVVVVVSGVSVTTVSVTVILVIVGSATVGSVVVSVSYSGDATNIFAFCETLYTGFVAKISVSDLIGTFSTVSSLKNGDPGGGDLMVLIVCCGVGGTLTSGTSGADATGASGVTWIVSGWILAITGCVGVVWSTACSVVTGCVCMPSSGVKSFVDFWYIHSVNIDNAINITSNK